MLVKVVVLFLVAMVVIAWIGGAIGKLRGPGEPRKLGGKYCSACGRPRIGKGPCACGRA